MTEKMEQVFLEIHRDMPRQGPGSYASTQKAFNMISLPDDATILDIGCGPGQQTLDLASLTPAKITAVDFYPVYLEELSRHIEKRGLDQISVRHADMNSLPFQPESFDLIWSEGAIYIIGFQNGLQQWRSFLKPRGYLAASEISWFRTDIPDELRNFWQAEYDIKTVEENLAIVRNSGYDVLGTFPLPASDWWEHYYSAIQARLPLFYEKYQDDAEALQVIRMEEEEMAMFQKYSDFYGYIFYILQKS